MGYNREFEINEAQIADYLQNAAEKVKTTEDAEILNKLQKLFKKDVPLTMRKYVIAYMLKESLKHYRYFGNNRRTNNERSERNNNNTGRNETKQNRNNREKPRNTEFVPKVEVEETNVEERPHHPRVEIAPEDATSIFISIGKNRRVFPRDLVGILIAIAGIERERIGDIKVLANYSFVQLYTEDAQNAIDKLNGYDYRGRKLAVSYSKQKTEEEGTESVKEVKSEKKEKTPLPTMPGPDISDEEMARADAAAYAAAEKAAKDKTPFGI